MKIDNLISNYQKDLTKEDKVKYDRYQLSVKSICGEKKHSRQEKTIKV